MLRTRSAPAIPGGAALSAVHLSRGPNALLMSLGSVATLASISASASGSAIGHVRPIVLRDGAVPLIGPAAATAAATASRLPVASHSRLGPRRTRDRQNVGRERVGKAV